MKRNKYRFHSGLVTECLTVNAVVVKSIYTRVELFLNNFRQTRRLVSQFNRHRQKSIDRSKRERKRSVLTRFHRSILKYGKMRYAVFFIR